MEPNVRAFLDAYDAVHDYIANVLMDDIEFAEPEQLDELQRLEEVMFKAREALY